MKKMFSLEAFMNDLSIDARTKALSCRWGWPLQCDGKDLDQLTKEGWHISEQWLVEVDDD